MAWTHSHAAILILALLLSHYSFAALPLFPENLMAFYDFDQPPDPSTVPDMSGVPPALDMIISNPSSVDWTSAPGALSLTTPDASLMIYSSTAADKLTNSFTTTRQWTVRALVTPTAGANTTGTGLPKRVVGISDGYICASSGGGSWDQDMILGFDRDTNSGVDLWVMRPVYDFTSGPLSTSCGLQLDNEYISDAPSLNTRYDLVVTMSIEADLRNFHIQSYIDGEKRYSYNGTTTYDIVFHSGFYLHFFDEKDPFTGSTGARQFLGRLYEVAFYNRTLNETEVALFNGESTTAPATTTPASTTTTPSPTTTSSPTTTPPPTTTSPPPSTTKTSTTTVQQTTAPLSTTFTPTTVPHTTPWLTCPQPAPQIPSVVCSNGVWTGTNVSVETNVTVTGPIIIVGDFNITSNRTVVDFQNPGVTVLNVTGNATLHGTLQITANSSTPRIVTVLQVGGSVLSPFDQVVVNTKEKCNSYSGDQQISAGKVSVLIKSQQTCSSFRWWIFVVIIGAVVLIVVGIILLVLLVVKPAAARWREKPATSEYTLMVELKN